MGNEYSSNLFYGLMCCSLGIEERPDGCRKYKCPYFKENDNGCKRELIKDALAYMICNERGKHLIEGLADIKDIQIRERRDFQIPVPDEMHQWIKQEYQSKWREARHGNYPDGER